MYHKRAPAKVPDNRRGVEFKLSVELAMPWVVFLVIVHTLIALLNL